MSVAQIIFGLPALVRGVVPTLAVRIEMELKPANLLPEPPIIKIPGYLKMQGVRGNGKPYAI